VAVTANDIKIFGSVNMPDDDTSTAGGAIRDTGHVSGGRIITVTDIAATDTFQVLSDGADTRTATVFYRLSTGVLTSEALVLNGTTAVTSSGQMERFMKITLSAKDAARTVTLRRTTGAVTIAVLGPNVTEARRLFYDAVSSAVQEKRYELVYVKNEHGSLALLAAKVKLTADPASRLKIGLEAAKGDAATVSNRKTAPAGVAFVDDNVDVNVPSGNLAAGERIGVWFEQTLPTNDPAFKNTFTLNPNGSST
jgi:hypothetical protein